MKSNKLCRMKKKFFLPMLVSLQLLFGSCENNFDPYIYGALLQGEYPSTEQEYVSYMMVCYLPYTTVWTYDMGSGGLQHGIHIQSGGAVRMFDSASDICAPATTVGADWERLSKGDYSNCFYYWRGNVDDGGNLNHFPKTAQVTRMTEVIGTLEKAPLTALTEEKKNNLMADELAGFVNMQADILRRHIHKDQWITTNLIPIFNPVDPVRIDHPDFLTYTRYLVTGHNQGIGSQGFRMGIPEDLGFSNDQFRNRVGKAFGVMELQPGQVNWGVYNPQPLPGAIRMWVYHVFAGGGKFVCNYRFRQPLKGSEQYHYGMIMTDGVTLSPGGEEYVRITQEMKKLRAAYDKKNRMPGQLASRRIGLLFDMSNYWEMEFQRQTDQWRTMAHVHKYYNLLKSFAAPVDVISEKEDFSGYPFLIAPAYQLLDNKLVERWTEYVKKGGHLILTCRTGQKDRDAKLWEAPLAAPIHQLAGINSLYYDHLPHNLYGKIDFEGKEFAWNNWGDVLTPAAGTDVWAVYTDQFYKGAASVIHRKLGKGTVTYIGTDTDDGKLEKEVVRRVYTEAGVSTEDLPYGVVKEWRDGFYIALNYTSDVQEIAIPDKAEILIGSACLEAAGVVVWKEKSDNRHK